MFVMLSGCDGRMTNIRTIAGYAIIAAWNFYLCMLAGHHGWFSWLYWLVVLASLAGFAGWLCWLSWLGVLDMLAGYDAYSGWIC